MIAFIGRLLISAPDLSKLNNRGGGRFPPIRRESAWAHVQSLADSARNVIGLGTGVAAPTLCSLASAGASGFTPAAVAHEPGAGGGEGV